MEDAREIIRRGCTGNNYFWIGDLGGYPPHDAETKGVPTPGGAEDHGEVTKETDVWEMVINPDRRGANGSGSRGAGGVHPTEAEHGDTVHHHPAHHGLLPEIKEAPGV